MLQDINAIAADCTDLIRQHGLDPETTRQAIVRMLEEQPLPLRVGRQAHPEDRQIEGGKAGPAATRNHPPVALLRLCHEHADQRPFASEPGSRLGHHRKGWRLHADHAVTDKRSSKEHEIEAEHDVALVFIDTKEKAYLSLTARAQVRSDHAKAAEIWKSADSVWWNGPDDPNVCVLLVRPVTAELWDGPASAAVAAFEFAKARLTGEKPNLGENRKVTLRM
jgi:general stress protein 26